MKRTSCSGVLFFLLALHSFCAPLDDWYRRNPTQQWDMLVSIAHGNGRFVAIGQVGTVIVSTNGQNWQVVQGKPYQTQLAFGNGVFVMVNGLDYFTSTNGVEWTERYSDAVNSRNRVVFCGGQFLALGWGEDVLTSPDGITWTRTLLPVPSGTFMSSAATGNGTTIAVGINSGVGVMVRTSNGIDWEQVPGSFASLVVAAFDGTEFLIHGGPSGALYASTNGMDWVNRALGYGAYPAIATHNGRTVLGGPTIAVLNNKVATFVNAPPLEGEWGVNALTVVNGTFWSVGMGGVIRYSANGINWTEVTKRIPGLAASQPFFGIGFDGKKFIAGGDSDCVTSTNGVNWVKMGTHPQIFTLDMTYANGRWVAVGGDYTEPQNQLIASSANGTNWTLHTLAGFTNEFLYRVKYLGGRFVAVGDNGKIAVSTNGINWVLRNVGAPVLLQSIAFGRGRYLAAGEDFTSGNSEKIYTSTDTITWMPHVINLVYRFNDITFGRNRFVAAVDTPLYNNGDQKIWTSTDGVNWKPHPGYAQRVMYEDGVFIAAGFGHIYTSFSGEQFKLQNEIINQEPYGIAFGQRSFVIVGNYASIVQSSPLPPFALVSVIKDESALGPLIELDTPAAGNHEFQFSSDMQNWTTFATINGTNEIMRVRHANAPAQGPAFYRAVLP
jgi:hypothetical protein